MYRVVCESDLARAYANWNTELALEHPKALHRCLWEQGIDIEYPIEVQEGLTHRDSKGFLSKGIRWVGVERTDDAWRFSDKISLEALYHVSDPYVRSEMARMQRTGENAEPFKKQDAEEIIFSLETVEGRNRNANSTNEN